MTASGGVANETSQKPVTSQLGLYNVRHVAGLFLEFLEEFLVVGIDRAAGKIEQVLGLVPPCLEPIWPRGNRAVEQPLKSVEIVVH